MELLVPDYVRTLHPYVPGKPIEETRRQYGLKRVIKLASNENPLGPSPKAVAAIKKALPELHRYPDASGFALKQTLSRHLKVDSAEIVLGNGSNEIIDLLICAYCIPGDAIVTSQAAFVAYKVCAQVHGVRTIETPLTQSLTFDLQAILKRAKEDGRVKFVFIPNPNNPTGTFVEDSELTQFLKELSQIRDGSVLAVLDYAYWEYCTGKELQDPLRYFKQFENVIVLRTFSKIYGLAGTRVGYGIGPKPLISTLNKIREPFNLNSLGLAGAQAALADQAFVKKAQKLNRQGLQFWKSALQEMGITVLPSLGNFLLADVQSGLGLNGNQVFEACLKKGVIFRPVTNYGLPNHLRISVGTPTENRIAAEVLWSIQGKPRKQRKAK